ncbi:MAG: DNA repair protein RecO [Spirochaetales bacterium]|uniref:DNA repair protein RecO n=1 Tax=Candidatus Thalassospirochaeta sargassi TaxID=3119039 RepID=A0AAJ1IDN7_9SPIO|nr:DNA repair protein RecO [Spirochaetales bacterium]
MNRNYTTEAVVLKTRRFGDFHKSVIILSPEFGIIEATAHGAYKGRSRLSSITDPFCVSVFDLYHNPVKDVWKINGCESRVINSRIRENLHAMYNASFWSELILKSHASGADFRNVYPLYTDALDFLEKNNNRGTSATIHFLYRFLINSGFITDFTECGHCGAALGSGAASAEPQARRRDSGAALGSGAGSRGGTLSFSPVEGCFLCPSCGSTGLPCLSYEDALYLQDSLSLHLAEAAGKRLDLRTEKEIRNMLLAVLKSIIDTPLNTLDYIDYGME